MEELDLSKELKDFYEKKKDNKLIRNYEETKNSYKGFLKISKIPSNVIGDGIEDIPDKLGKESLSWVVEITRYVHSFFNEKDKQNFVFSTILSKKMEVFYFNTFLLFEHSFLKFVKVDYSNFDMLTLLENNNILEYEIILKKSREGINLNQNGLILKEIDCFIRKKIQDQEKVKNDKFKEEQRLKEEKRLKELQVSKTNVLSELNLDKDGNGEVDVVEGNDFNTLLKKHQKSIVEVDRNYIQQFVKVSSYLKTKKGNIQSIFSSIKDIPSQELLNEYVEILKDEIHTYNLVLFNSLNMIVSLVEDDMITFYEIHEMFDTLNMFDSKHEKDVSQKLTNIGDGLKDLMYEIRRMGNKISNSIDKLTYVTEESNKVLKEQLSRINSKLKVGNFINTINTYQNYKTNRRLNS